MLNDKLVSRVALATLRPMLVLLLLLLLLCAEASPIEIVFCYTSVDCPHAVMYCDETLGFCFNCSDVTRCAPQFYPHDYDDCRRRCPGESDMMGLVLQSSKVKVTGSFSNLYKIIVIIAINVQVLQCGVIHFL